MSELKASSSSVPASLPTAARGNNGNPPAQHCVTELKIVLFGQCGAGKTSLLRRFVHSTFSESSAYSPTIGASYLACPLTLSDTKIKLHLWDITGT